MSVNNNSVSAQALLEMDAIVSALKEESKHTISNLLSEAVKGALRESVEEEDKEDGYEVIDDDKNDAKDKKDESEKAATDVSETADDEMGQMPQDGQAQEPAEEMPQDGAEPQMGSQEAPVDGAEGQEAEVPAEGEGEEGWDEFSKYQVGDNTYDLTGENDYDNVVKVYKLLKDDDQVVVKKDGDKISLQDGGAGTEYLIDLGSDEGEETEQSEEPIEGEEETPNNLSEGFNDPAGFPSQDDDESNVDLGLTDGSFDSDEMGGENKFQFENKKSRKPMKESKEVLFEVDLGYTDNYQDKDPIKGLSNTEPSKSGKSWHKGVPTGTEKPWAGPSKDKGKPFGVKTVEEEDEKCCPKCGKSKLDCTCSDDEKREWEDAVDEATNVGGFVQQNSTVGSHIPNSNGRKARSQRSASQGVEVTGTPDPRYKGVNESKELKAIKAENRELKKAVLELRKNLNEAYITNVNLGKITKLFLENTTSKAEKIDIINRFSNEAKNVEQSKTLYESITRELKKNNSNPMAITESSPTANGTKALNEQKVYQSNDVLRTIDLMNRVNNC